MPNLLTYEKKGKTILLVSLMLLLLSTAMEHTDSHGPPKYRDYTASQQPLQEPTAMAAQAQQLIYLQSTHRTPALLNRQKQLYRWLICILFQLSLACQS